MIDFFKLNNQSIIFNMCKLLVCLKLVFFCCFLTYKNEAYANLDYLKFDIKKSEIPNNLRINILKAEQRDFLLSYHKRNAQMKKTGLFKPDLNKEKFKIEVIVDNEDSSFKLLKGQMRFHGDYRDHYLYKEGLSSMHVELEEGNLGGVTRFKIFLPGSRQYMNEIFATKLFI